MRLLKTLVAHKANTKISVGGATYLINADCQVDVEDEHADKLLANRSWRDANDTRPVRSPVASRPKPTGKIKLLDATGQKVKGQIGEEEKEKKAAPKPAEPALKKGEDPPIPEEGEEWSDPKPDYSLKWLRKCADTYEIPYPKNIGRSKLCEKILAAMYG